MKTTFSISKEEVERLESRIGSFGKEAEKIINDYLWGDGFTIAEKAIKKHIPVSDRKKRSKGMPKLHAKFGNSLNFVKRNLGFMVTSTKPYYYLLYPALGIGTSKKNVPDDFMNNGLNEVKPQIINDLETKLIEGIKNKI